MVTILETGQRVYVIMQVMNKPQLSVSSLTDTFKNKSPSRQPWVSPGPECFFQY